MCSLEHHWNQITGGIRTVFSQNNIGVNHRRVQRVFSQNTIGVKSQRGLRTVLSQKTIGFKTQGGLRSLFSQYTITMNHRGHPEHCSRITPLESSYRGNKIRVLSDHHWSQITGEIQNCLLPEHHWSQVTEGTENSVPL